MPDIPEWVQVWSWLRFLRGPQDMTPLPQQGDDPENMSQERYLELRQEWVDAGRPSMSLRTIVAVMSGSVAVVDDDGIPF